MLNVYRNNNNSYWTVILVFNKLYKDKILLITELLLTIGLRA
jgi:hypothetical protein